MIALSRARLLHRVHGMGTKMGSEWGNVGRDREPNIEIPDCERLPLPPSMILQGRFQNWRDGMTSSKVPDLRDRTLEEVR